MYLPSVATTSEMLNPQKVGQKTTTAAPTVKSPAPISMPKRRPRRSAIAAANGPKVPTRLRAVSAYEKVVRSTPRLRAKIARNG